jgi:hypothetical protein
MPAIEAIRRRTVEGRSQGLDRVAADLDKVAAGLGLALSFGMSALSRALAPAPQLNGSRLHLMIPRDRDLRGGARFRPLSASPKVAGGARSLKSRH